MKHVSLLLIIVFAGLYAFAQQTLTIPYQALVRDAAGNPVTYQQIGAKITLLQDSIAGQEVFSETHTTTTNAFGQMELQIGSVETAAFDTINWSAGKIFIKLEVDITGGTVYQEIATVPLLAVPFAKYAEEAAGWKKNETGISFMEGNVGIGSTNSNSRLSIGNGSINEQGIHINAKINSVLRFYRNGVGKWGIIDNLGEDGSLCFYNYKNNRISMSIDSIGNIGIGATHPTAKLEISGTGNNNNATLLRLVGAETEPLNYSLSFDKIFTDGNGYPIYDWQLNQRQYNGNYGNVLTIYRNGFVGINNTTPTFRLHVNGTIKGTNVMYDYSKTSSLFENPQQVISLNELEQFINTEKQLPGQNQIVENDTVVDLAKMNAFLINKIEELTIYTIQQQKEIESQILRFEKLEAEIETLKNK